MNELIKSLPDAEPMWETIDGKACTVYSDDVARQLTLISRTSYRDIKAAIALYGPEVGFVVMVSNVAHLAATVATNAAKREKPSESSTDTVA